MKKKGIIERLVMGKTREKDLTEADLPATRRKQFAFVFRTRFGIIFRANLLAALFCLPLMIWDILAGGYVGDYVADMSVAEQFSNLIYLTLLQYGTEVPLLMLAAVGLAGCYYVIRRICWGQSVKIVADFFKGIKDSWLQFLLLGLLSGLVNFLCRYILSYCLLTMAGGNAILWGLAITAVAIFAVLYCIMLMFALCQGSLYKLSFARLIGNSTVMTFKKLPLAFLICLLSVAPILVFAVFPWFFVKIIGCCVAVVFSIGFAATVQTVYCHKVFDEMINAESYPDFVGMGLAGKEEQDEDNG